MQKTTILGIFILTGMMIGSVNFDRAMPLPGNPKSAGASPKKVTVPAGTRILIRTVESLDTTKQMTGHRFTGTLETNLMADKIVVAPRGTEVYGQLKEVSSAGRFQGKSQLTLELTDIVINGTAHPLVTSSFEIRGKSEGKRTARKVVGGAGLGGLIGGIAGGGTGFGIGLLAGGAGGAAMAGSKKGQQLNIPSESLIEFRIEQPVVLPVAR